MSILREISPTAGIPIYLKDILGIFAKKSQGSLEEAFKEYLSSPYARLTCSGTVAFYLILESLKKISSKKTVVIPSFVCPLVCLAIQRAGLKFLVCDIDKGDFNFNPKHLSTICANNPDILAIVPVHLAGIPIDFNFIATLAKKYNIFTIEDCAQSLGALYKGKQTGTLGDFAFFSLCRGKGLTIYEGGMITCHNKEHSRIIDQTLNCFLKNDLFAETLKTLEILGYWLIYRPRLFWWAYQLPRLFWEIQNQPLRAAAESYAVNFPVHKVWRIRDLIGYSGFHRLEEEIRNQRQKAGYYIENLKNIPGLNLITEKAGDKANYPYLTVVFDDPEKCQKARRLFKNSGLGIAQVYLCAITEYDYLKNMLGGQSAPSAESLARRQISLSTNAFLKKNDLDIIITKIRKL
jgi:dTDP-4-amino-4,6-dideoxygalactose transaminase